MNLTENEIKVLRSLRFNHYGTEGDGVWSWAVNESDCPSQLNGKILSGVVSSLCQKGIYRSEEYEKNENVLYLTKLGKETMKEIGLIS